MEFRTLGGLAVTHDGSAIELGGRKQRAVLAALLLDLGRPVSAGRLEEQVWGEEPPANPEASLQAYISNLRRLLEPGRPPRQPARLLVTQPAGYALLADPADVDVIRFEHEVRRGRELAETGDPAAATAVLDAALALWVGPLLPELAGQPLVDAAAARLDGLRAEALELRFTVGLDLAQHAILMARIEAAVAEHPYRERFRAQLALARYRSGRQRDALAAIDEARRTLVDEVGIDPGPELKDLERRILDQDPSLDLAAPTAPTPAAMTVPPAARPSQQQPVGGVGPAEPVAPSPAASAGPPRHDGSPFVGRGRELAALLEAASAAAAGNGRAVVISGEPGIGKTRIVEELTSALPDVTVAWGRCPEMGSAAYWPCVQIGRQLEGNDAIASDLVSELLPAVPQAVDTVSSADRFSLNASVVQVLASARRPVVVVVDDIQWADPASLRIIEYAAAELRHTRVLLVATVRPVAPDASPALVDCLGELARSPGALRLDLGGLTGDDVGRWITEHHGPAPEQVATYVHGRTAGNPFFVGEVLALLASEGRLADVGAVRAGATVPAAVQDVVRRRVSRLPAACQQLLALASVIGRTFDVDVLAAVAGEPAVEVLERIDDALAVGLLAETDLPGRFAFSHALVAETLEAEVAPGRRARLHAATAEALARLRASDLDSWLTDLAHHAVGGMAAGSAEAAYDWSVRAAEQASLQLAHEDAALHWERALRALELARPGDAEARHHALLEQGRAWLATDDVTAGYGALTSAIDLAIALDRPDLAATAGAAMSIEGMWQAGEVALTAGDAVRVLEQTALRMDPTPSAARAKVLGSLAENAYWLWPPERLDEVSAEAVAVARATGDPVMLGRALHKRNQTLWRPGTLEERATAAFELLDLVGAIDPPPDLRAVAHLGAAGVLWEQADARRAYDLVVAARHIAEAMGSPALLTQIGYFDASLLGFFGRLDECEAAGDRAHELYRRTRRWIADAIYAGNRLVPLLEQDRLDELDAMGQHLLETEYRPWFQEAYAYALVLVGRLEDAADVVGGTLPPLFDTWMSPGVLAGATMVRAALGDVEGVRTLRPYLLPLLGRLATAGTGPAFGDIHGAVAEADLLLGDRDGGLDHLDASIDVLTRAGAGPFLARALLRRAELRPEGAAADRAAADALIERDDLVLLRRQRSSG